MPRKYPDQGKFMLEYHDLTADMLNVHADRNQFTVSTPRNTRWTDALGQRDSNAGIDIS